MTTKNDENDASKQEGKSTMHDPRPKQYEMLATGLVGLAKEIQQQAKGFFGLDKYQALALASQSIAATHLAGLATESRMSEPYEKLATDLVGLAKQIQQQAKDFGGLKEHQALTLASQSIAAIHLEEWATKLHIDRFRDSDVLEQQTPPFE